MKSSPCKACEDRAHGCHGSCGSYAEWKAGIREAADRKTALTNADVFRTSCYMKSKNDWIKSHK